MIKSTPEMMPSAIPTAASLNVGSASQISRGRGYTTNQPAKDNQNTIVTTPKMVDVFFNDCFLPNEPVEKVPTRKKRSELGVPKWFLDLRSSLKRQIRRPFFLQLLPSHFFYRLNDKADLSGVPPDQCQAACYLGLSIEYRIFPNFSVASE